MHSFKLFRRMPLALVRGLGLLVCASIVTAFSTTCLAGRIEVIDENSDYFGLIPEFMLDHSGFEIVGEKKLAIPGIDRATPPIPLLPIFDKGVFSNAFVGVKVPAEFLRGPVPVRLRTTTTNFGTVPVDQSEIADAIAEIRFDDGTRLVPYLYNGELYGIRSDFRVSAGNETTVGLSLQFGGGKTIQLGSRSLRGAALQLGGSTSYIGGDHGVNLFSGFQKFFDIPSELQDGDDQLAFYRRTVQFAPYIRHYLSRNAEGLRVPVEQVRATQLQSVSSELTPPEEFSLVKPVQTESLSGELRTALSDLKDPDLLSREVQWKKDVGASVDFQLVLDSRKANDFVQILCDQLAAAYDVPNELRPRCRIAATWSPNAWAYPGGDIFVSAGLIGVLSDLDSLRLVIGHEIGHVVGRHTTRAMPARKAFMYAAGGVSLAAQIGMSSFALTGGQGLIGSVNWLTWFPQVMALSTSGAIVQKVGLELLFLGPYAALMAHSRSMEWQADRFGHESALATGADPQKLGLGWLEFKNFIVDYLDPDGSSLNSILASHPNPQARYEEIERRGIELQKSLGDYSVNRLPESFYEDYRELHLQFKPNVMAWGEKAKLKKSAETNTVRGFSMESYLSPSGQCVVHALYGHGLFQSELH